MKLVIMNVLLAGHISSNRCEPELLHRLMFANDIRECLTKIEAEYQERYPMLEMFELTKEDGSIDAYGTGSHGECFRAAILDPLKQPYQFQQALKELQDEFGCNELQERIFEWAEAYPSDAVRMLDVLDAEVGIPFVDDIWAFSNLRPRVAVWRERSCLDNSVQPAEKCKTPKGL